MNQFSRIVVSGLIALSLAGAAVAADTPKDKKPAAGADKTPAATTEHRFRGSVTALDTKAGTLKVKGRNDEKTFIIGDKAKSAFDKVKVGDRVRLTYADEGGKLIIRALTESKSGSDKSGK
ncbi:MAG: hypothetical protein FJ145_10515 [Deltaproteobacteria bacterium]|nr:hypothetical protein [Deltaproteobacteria bacterium]